MTESGKYLAVARILRPQGRKGEVAAEILTDFPERFRQLKKVFLGASGQASRSADLENSWPHKGQIILKFDGVDTIDGASELRNLEVLIPWDQRVPLPPDRYYVSELRGCHVFWERNNIDLGEVVEVEPTGGVDILHVRRPDGKSELLIPLAQEICKRIDPDARKIVVDPPEDLLELNDQQPE